jgi:hypothetical protein
MTNEFERQQQATSNQQPENQPASTLYFPLQNVRARGLILV